MFALRGTTGGGMNRSRAALVTLAVVFGTLAARNVQSRPSRIDGMWDLGANVGMRGWASWSDGRYIYFFTRTDTVPPAAVLTDATRAQLYRRLAVEAWTYTVADTLVTCKPEHSKDPRRAPASWRWSFR